MLLPFDSIETPYIHRFVRQCAVILTIPLLWDTRPISNRIHKNELRLPSADFSELQTHFQKKYACRSISVDASGRYPFIPSIRLSVLQTISFVPHLFSTERVARLISRQPS